MAEALSYAAPAARSAWVVDGADGCVHRQFADAGIDASRAGTALNAILSQFQDPPRSFARSWPPPASLPGIFDKALRLLAKGGNSGEKAIIAVGTEAVLPCVGCSIRVLGRSMS